MMANASKLVCIVDNELSVRRALIRLMQAHGYDAIAYSSGRECLDSHEVAQADAMIIDVSLPGMTGFELLTLLRTTERNIPTIMMSAHADEKYAPKTKSVGAVALLYKPCDENVLLAAVKSAAGA